MWSSINDADTGIDLKWNNLLSQEFVCRLGTTTGLILVACAPLQCLLPSSAMDVGSKGQLDVSRCPGKDRMGL